MEPNTETITLAALVSLLVTGVVTYILHRLLAKEAKKILDDLEFLKLQYSTAIKKIEYDLENRRKTQIVAELFSLWGQTIPLPNKSFKNLSPDEYKKLIQLSYECALWLPPQIFNDLSDRLVNAPNAKHIKQILVDVRMHLNPEIGIIDATKIIHF